MATDIIISAPMTATLYQSTASQVTILVPTANRPEHLYRFLRYYAEHSALKNIPILVADSSTPDQARQFDELAHGIAPDLSYRLMRNTPETPFFAKLRHALAAVATDYVMLAADDDFFFVDWIGGAITHLVNHQDTTAVIGNYFLFGMDGFTAFSSQLAISDGGPERFTIPWLGGGSVEERVDEIARNPQGIQTIGWYALHRTDVVRGIVDHLAGHDDLPLLFAERFFTVAQAAAGKTFFTPEIFLARQADADPAHRSWRAEPMGYAAHRDAIERMQTITRSYLTQVLGVSDLQAALLVNKAFAHEIAMMRQADRRRIVRRVVNRFGLRRFIAASRTMTAPPCRDPRLPQGCEPAEMARKAAIIRYACLSDADRALLSCKMPSGNQSHDPAA